jgi:hypothetical protein
MNPLMVLPRSPYKDFRAKFRSIWEQGEHVFISAKTGSGKTELLQDLMAGGWNSQQKQKHGVIFCTKPGDPIFRSIAARAYRKVNEWSPRSTDTLLMLTPSDKAPTTDEIKREQARVFNDAMNKIYHSEGWTVGLDEVLWLSQQLRLDSGMSTLAFMGRAKGITLIAATQRPKRIPVIIPQSSSYAFVGRAMRDEDLQGLAELSAVDRRETMAAIRQVTGKHDFLFIDTTGRMPLQIVNTRV